MTEQKARGLYFSQRLLLVATALLAAVPYLFGQTNIAQGGHDAQAGDAATSIPKFAVASVKPNTLNGGWRLRFTPNGLSALGVTMRMLVKEAYGIGENNRISGTQNWLDSERFDIEAKIDDADVAEFQKLNYDQRLPMLQALLADRFKLAVHLEDRELPIYAMTVAKSGPRLIKSKSDCTNRPPTFTRAMPGQMTVECFTMTALSRYLSSTPSVGRYVADKTGLTGRYDFKLDWTPDTLASPIANASNSISTSPESSGPSIFTAIQEQLGLKLESQKGPVKILIINHVERPSEN